MAAKLISEEGDLKGLVLSLEDGNEWVIGRDPDECKLVIPDPLISRKHAIVYTKPEGLYLQNLSETNPSVVNDEEMDNQPKLLHHGDSIKFGNEVFRYYTDSEAHILDEEYPAKIIDQENTAETPSEDAPPFEENNENSLEDKNNLTPLIETSSSETPSQEPTDQTMSNPTQDTILQENDEDFAPLAEINFGLADFGRWLVKVVNGPNNGAEFYMQSGYSYILGTDPNTCDIVFYDTSVSRQHAKIIVTDEDTLLIEDLNSKNGVLVNGKQIEGKESLEPTQIVTLGTTALIVYDREGEMQTIISPLLPSIVKVLQEEERKTSQSGSLEPFISSTEPIVEPEPPYVEPPKPKSHFGKLLLLASLVGLFLLIGMGTNALFKNDPVQEVVNTHAEEAIEKVMTDYPSVKWAYNKSTGGVLLLGHVSTSAEKNQLLYTLHSLPTVVKAIDDSGIIIDEGVWREINSILSKNAAWQGITIHSPEAGKFVLSGTLKTRHQAEQLYDYIGINFPYLDLLKRDVLVEEDVINQIKGLLLAGGYSNVVPKMVDGEVSLSGNIPSNLAENFPPLLDKIKAIPGLRAVYNFTQIKTEDMGIKNITSQYQVTGSTKVGSKYTVQINGRILSEGDRLDNMVITRITVNAVFLEDANKKYRIDYKS